MPEKYKLSILAANDIGDIFDYTIERHGEAQAEKYINQLYDRFQWLAENPMLGLSRNEIGEGYRNWNEGKHNIFYRITGDNIEILGLVGPGMKIESHLTP